MQKAYAESLATLLPSVDLAGAQTKKACALLERGLGDYAVRNP